MDLGNWNMNNQAEYLRFDGQTIVESQVNQGSQSGLIQSFKELVETDKEIILELLDLTGEIEKSHQKLKYAKATGTSLGVVGAGSLLGSLALAPFTAGASTLLTVAGFGATIVSGVTAAGTEIVGHKRTKDYVQRIKNLQVKQENAANTLTNQLAIIGLIVEELTNTGLSENIALSTTVNYIQRHIQQLFSTDQSFNMQNITDQLQVHINAIRDLASLTVGLGTTGSTLGSIAKESIINAARQFGEITATEIQSLRTTMRAAAQTVSARTIAKRVGIIASVIFTVVDVTLLIKNWNNEHPLMQTIHELVENLIQDCNKCNDMALTLERIQGNGMPGPESG